MNKGGGSVKGRGANREMNLEVQKLQHKEEERENPCLGPTYGDIYLAGNAQVCMGGGQRGHIYFFGKKGMSIWTQDLVLMKVD